MDKEGVKLADLISRDRRTKRELAQILGVDPTYLSRVERVDTLSVELAQAATRLWNLEPGYFKRSIEPPSFTPADEQIIHLLSDILNELKILNKK